MELALNNAGQGIGRIVEPIRPEQSLVGRHHNIE